MGRAKTAGKSVKGSASNSPTPDAAMEDAKMNIEQEVS